MASFACLRLEVFPQVGQVCIMIHSGSRGLGHQVATDALTSMERAMSRDNIAVNDRQLACAHIDSQEGQVCLCPVKPPKAHLEKDIYPDHPR